MTKLIPNGRHYFGVSLMILAMLVIPISDGIVKLLSKNHAVLLLNWMRFLIGGMIFLPCVFIFYKEGKIIRINELFSLTSRSALHVLAISLYFLAIARVPLADALGAYFIAPIVAVVVAAWHLNENISRLQMVAVLIGFMGSMIVVRPGASINIGMVYAVLSGIVFGLFLVLTRQAGQSVAPVITLGFQCLVGTFLLFPVAINYWAPIAWSDVALILAAGIIWAFGHLCIIKAFSFAPTSVLAPIVYMEIIGGAGAGYFLFGDFPGLATATGIVLVVIAGILVQYRKVLLSKKANNEKWQNQE